MRLSRVNSLMIRSMVKPKWYMETVIPMKEVGKLIKNMEEADINSSKESRFMKESGLMT